MKTQIALAVLALLTTQSSAFTVTAHYPNQQNSLYLRGRGCGLNWYRGIQMNHVSATQWQVNLDCTASLTSIDSIDMKVLVNDQDWMLGANAVAKISTPLGSAEIYPWFYTTEGSLKVFKDVWSPQLNNTRDVIVYLPPSYKENTLKVHSNVLVMHDGNNLFDPATAFLGNSWLIQNTLNPLINEGQIEEMLVIGAYNTGDRMNEYTYSFDKSEGFGGKGDLYLDWIEHNLLPFAQQNLRIKLDFGKSLGIMGSSLGGLISCYAGWTRPSIYGRVGCMSSSFWWNDQDFQNQVLPQHKPSFFDQPKFYIDSGTEGGEASCAQFTLEIEQYLNSKGFVSGQNVKTYIDQGGQHNEYFWGHRFSKPISFLYPAGVATQQNADTFLA